MSGYPDNNPKTLAGSLKIPLHLVPPVAIDYLALALEDGAKKYGPYNWRQAGISASVYRAARLRHDGRFWDGEDTAPDSRIHHLAHIMACCAIELDAIAAGMWRDDRPPMGGSPQLQDAYAEKRAPGIKYGELYPHDIAKAAERDLMLQRAEADDDAPGIPISGDEE